MGAKEQQESVKAKIIVRGRRGCGWKRLLPKTVNIHRDAKWVFGAKVLGTEEYLRKLAEVNAVSYERGIVGMLLGEGFVLEKLVVECSSHPEWGIMTWYSDHKAYHEKPLQSWEKNGHLSFWRSIFKTKLGDQKFGLYSTAANAAGLHKTFIYHKVVFSLPKKATK